jgi:long-chain acyl-CoA synthetase
VALSYEEAIARVTGPGQVFEITDVEIDGLGYKAFTHAPTTLRAAFDSARNQGENTFVVYEGERWTFADVMAHVDALGSALVHRYGIAKGDRVAIGMRNLPEWVISFAAVISIGAVSVSLNAWWTEEELDYALSDCGASLLIADAERVVRSRIACQRLGIDTIVVRAGEDDANPPNLERMDAVVNLGDSLPEVPISPDDDATILYTSGTTGQPKGAVSTHRAVTQALFAFGCASAVQRERSADRPEKAKPTEEARASMGKDLVAPNDPTFILIVPLFHVTGCIPVMMSCFYVGMKLVMMHKWDPDVALELIERERVTNFVGVPTQSWDLLESPRFAEYDTSSLLSIGGGGAPAPPKLVHRVEDNFRGRPQIGYGMTETNAYGPGNFGEDYVTHPLSTGRAVPILEIAVRDPDGRAVPAGERGEIWFKGPNLIRGYWAKPEATAETMVEGWLRTGDIGRIDGEGFVYVEDRVKDMVLRAGENVYCAEVEAALYEHPAVYEAAVFGVPHERLGEEVVAVINPKNGQTTTVEALQGHVAEHLAPFKVPSRIVFVKDRLPRSASGKILKRELRTEHFE